MVQEVVEELEVQLHLVLQGGVGAGGFVLLQW